MRSAAMRQAQSAIVWLSTAAFAASFAVWALFAVVGLVIKDELALSATELGLLIGTPILAGSVMRVLIGASADRYGGKRILTGLMLAAAAATALASYAQTYAEFLLAGLGIGIAGGSFSAGSAFIAQLVPARQQDRALGLFSAGTSGIAITSVMAPLVITALGWQAAMWLWAAGLATVAIAFFTFARGVFTRETLAQPAARLRPSWQQQLVVLKNVQVWRFSLYYFVVFGGFLALALWLPYYLIGAYGVDLEAAGALAALFSIPATLFRAYGRVLAGRHGARTVMYWALGMAVICAFMLSYPPTTYIIQGARGPITFSTSLSLVPFGLLMMTLGFFMGIGKAAFVEHIPRYYPNHVGIVSGVAGMVGGLGGFLLLMAFAVINDLTGIWTSAFALLFLMCAMALGWLLLTTHQMRRSAREASLPLSELPEFPEMQGLGQPSAIIPRPQRAGPIADWRPEETEFWHAVGRPIARRNLWISTYCLLLAFAVWMVWSVIVARLPAVGFNFSADQLFWLAALPGLSGAILRIFYAFMVPIFGGRLWTAVSTALLLIPALGIGYAVQNPGTPYLIFLVLALLSGLGGGSFASSVANIGFFFPKAEKGSALAVNSGLGNIGVSLMQLLVPVAITMSLFGALGGTAQTAADGTRFWMQNAGFIWVLPILVGTVAAWLGMNDIVSAKSSFMEQSVIFGRRHTWLMCLLYTGTFGTFIGMSAGFPLLAAMVFPEVNALNYAFVGPLVGALARAGSGWIADRLGGARVSFWVFLLMIGAVIGMIGFLHAKSFAGFFSMVLALFVVSGVGNASTFQMVPGIMRRVIARESGEDPAGAGMAQAERESAAITGFISAIAAFGAFYIPTAYGVSISVSGSPNGALWGFVGFYILCAAITWRAYCGGTGLLARAEQSRGTSPNQNR